MMRVFRVGGAVRDALLGLPVQDIDYVVVGSTPEEMIAAGYVPVGKDFPVFLHPISKAEYALARTERKSAPGYHGFVFHCAADVTLEEDLQRRDLTINAMAIAENSNEPTSQSIIDPFGGQRDLAAKIFRHVSDAFAEDPVRILRLARFAARFSEFSIAPETMQLMRNMVTAGEVDALVSERVWQELARGLMEMHPSRMLTVLHECGALARIIPEFDATWTVELGTVSNGAALLDYAAQQSQPLAVRWAVACLGWLHGEQAGLSVDAICSRLKVPIDVRDVALISCREFKSIRDAASLSAAQTVQLIERCDAIRRPERFTDIVAAVRCSCRVAPNEFLQQRLLEGAMSAIRTVPNGEIAQQVTQKFPGQKEKIAEHIFDARVDAVALKK